MVPWLILIFFLANYCWIRDEVFIVFFEWFPICFASQFLNLPLDKIGKKVILVFIIRLEIGVEGEQIGVEFIGKRVQIDDSTDESCHIVEKTFHESVWFNC